MIALYDLESVKREDNDCSMCGEPFTKEEWDERHSDSSGGDCHAECCDVCAAEEVEGMDLEDAFDLLMGE